MFSTGLARWQDAETRQAGQIHVETLVMSPRGQGCLLAESSTLSPNGPFIRGPGGPPSFPISFPLAEGLRRTSSGLNLTPHGMSKHSCPFPLSSQTLRDSLGLGLVICRAGAVGDSCSILTSSTMLPISTPHGARSYTHALSFISHRPPCEQGLCLSG